MSSSSARLGPQQKGPKNIGWLGLNFPVPIPVSACGNERKMHPVPSQMEPDLRWKQDFGDVSTCGRSDGWWVNYLTLNVKDLKSNSRN